MLADEVHAVMADLRAAGFGGVWIAGGWGVDALIGRQTRCHRDLDLAIDLTRRGLDHLLPRLERRGYRLETDWRPSRLELSASRGRRVDLHPVVFDVDGIGWQSNLDGQEPFRYGRNAFSRGVIEGRPVDCLSVEQQRLFHRGYLPLPHDRQDLTLLQSLIGIPRNSISSKPTGQPPLR
jgi:lincosamide nucleotidyltransferase A/C/D/E